MLNGAPGPKKQKSRFACVAHSDTDEQGSRSKKLTLLSYKSETKFPHAVQGLAFAYPSLPATGSQYSSRETQQPVFEELLYFWLVEEMRAPLAATLVLAHLAMRSLGFSPSVFRGGGAASAAAASFRHALRRSHGGHTTRGAFPTRAATPQVATTPKTCRTGETVGKMVLRPDWEREGRVHGLRLPPERTAERAFEYLVDYPCEFQIKVIGVNEGSFADDIAATVSAVCEVG